MIGLLTKVNILDNSGGLEGKCIKILKPKSTKSGRKQRTAKVGDVILISITKALPSRITGKKKEKGSIFKALVVRTKKESNKYIRNINNGTLNKKIKNIYNNKEEYESNILNVEKKIIKKKGETVKNAYDDNGVVLVNIKNENDYTPLGTRVKGPICKNLKKRKGCLKIISITT
jgi:ribosomal protein L14